MHFRSQFANTEGTKLKNEKILSENHKFYSKSLGK